MTTLHCSNVQWRDPKALREEEDAYLEECPVCTFLKLKGSGIGRKENV